MSHEHHHGHSHDDDDCCSVEQQSSAKHFMLNREYIAAGVSFFLLISGIVLDHFYKDEVHPYLRLCYYLIAYFPVGWPVWRNAFSTTLKGDVFNEFILMGLATIGAFFVGEYPEAVAVMLFYSIGELFQGAAVRKAKGSIKALLDLRPDQVIVLENGNAVNKKAEHVLPNEIIRLRPGDKLPLDGELLSERSAFNTSALTGESLPRTFHKGEPVLAGMISTGQECEIKVTHRYSESRLSKILTLVQEATAHKAPTELFIRKFSRIYTPIVFGLAVLIVVVPYILFLLHASSFATYHFNGWLYRALIFLVVSCPCALVISIPLGYFGGIGAGSRNGILFKGSTYLDLMASVKAVVMDKTGTLTKAVFKVQEVKITQPFIQEEILAIARALESRSTHPVAKGITEYAENISIKYTAENIEEIAGHGLKGIVDGKKVLAGNLRLLDKFGVSYDAELKNIPLTLIAIAVDKKFAGYITISDEIKDDALSTIASLNKMGIETILLSGDKNNIVHYTATKLKISKYYGELLPEEKVKKLKEVKDLYRPVAFVGDGINDAPVIAVSDIGVAMGGLGSEAAIESADIVIQNDMLSRIITAIGIGKATKAVVWQNIALAFGVKLAVILLGAGGLATMWEAVFADVGVAFLAILNAMRIQKIKF